MSDSVEPGEFEIEEVRRRREKHGAVEYRIKWLGFPDEDNTWQVREDLVADGFEAVVDEYDAMLLDKEKSRKSSRKSTPAGRRARSKTPLRKASTKASAKATEDDEDMSDNSNDDDDDDDDDEEGEEKQEEEEGENGDASGAKAGKAADGARAVTRVLKAGQQTEQGALVTTFLVTFLGAAVISVVLQSVKAHMDDGAPAMPIDDWSLNLMMLVVYPLPMFLCLRAVLLRAASTDFSNRASAMLVWAGMTKFCDALRHFETGADSGSQTLLFAMGMWLVLCVLALHSSSMPPSSVSKADEGETDAEHATKKHKEEVAALTNWISLTLYFAVMAVMFQLDRHPLFADHRLALPEKALVGLSLTILARATARLLVSLCMDASTPLHLWVELFGVAFAVCFVGIQLLELNPKYAHMLPRVQVFKLRQLPVANASSAEIRIPLFKITHDIFMWAHAAAFMSSAILPRP